MTADLAEIELHPRHEQRQGHAEREHHRHEALELHEVEHVGSDQDAEQHLDDDDRDLESERNLGEQRRQDGAEQDPEDRVANRHLRLLKRNKRNRSGRSLERVKGIEPSS